MNQDDLNSRVPPTTRTAQSTYPAAVVDRSIPRSFHSGFALSPGVRFNGRRRRQ